jgi:hypothetical protein
MDDAAREGRRIIAIVIAGLLLHSLVMLAVPGRSFPRRALELLVAGGMSLLMWRGYSWARSYLAFVLGGSAIGAAIMGLWLTFSVGWGAVLLLFPPLYGWGAWALWSSPKVDAYIEHRERKRNPDMSFGL